MNIQVIPQSPVEIIADDESPDVVVLQSDSVRVISVGEQGPPGPPGPEGPVSMVPGPQGPTGGTSPTMEVESRTSMATTTISAAISRIRIGRFSASHAHAPAWYERGNDTARKPVLDQGGVSWHLSQQQDDMFVEAIGILGGSANDDTQGFIDLAAYVNAVGGGVTLHCYPGQEYVIWPTDGSIAGPGALCMGFSGIRGLRWHFNGAFIHIKYTGLIQTYLMQFSACQDVHVYGFKSIHDQGYVIYTSPNLRHVRCIDACKDIHFSDGEISGGVHGFGCVRYAGPSPRCERLSFTGKISDIYYAIDGQSDGDNCYYDVICQNIGRALIVYNCRGTKARVEVDDWVNQPIMIASYAQPTTNESYTEIEVWVRTRGTTAFANYLIGVTAQQGSPGTYEGSATIRAKIHLDIGIGSTPSTTALVVLHGYKVSGGVQVLGTPATPHDVVVDIDGSIFGSCASGVPYWAELGTASSGWEAPSKPTVNIKNLIARDLDRPLLIGETLRGEITNSDLPLMALAWEGEPNQSTFRAANSILLGATGAAATYRDAMSAGGIQINGGFDVSQEKGTTPTTATGYICDGWMLAVDGTASVSAVPNVGTGTTYGPNNSDLAISVATAQASMSAGNFVFVMNIIEGLRAAKLLWGTSYAMPITIAFWSRHHRAGTYSVSVRNGAQNRSYAATYTQNVSDAAEFKVITIPGDITGTWTNNNTLGLTINFTMAAGSTFTAPTAGVWASGNYLAAPGQVNGVASTDDVFSISGVMVLPGIEVPTAATVPSIIRPIDQELLLCQRYYQQVAPSISCNGHTDAVSIPIWMSQPMRSTPSLTHPYTDASFTNSGSPGATQWNLQSPQIGTATKTGTVQFDYLQSSPKHLMLYMYGCTFSRLTSYVGAGASMANIALNARL